MSEDNIEENTPMLLLSLGLACGLGEFLMAEGPMILAPQYYETYSILVIQPRRLRHNPSMFYRNSI
jgi:hypothetical protein